MSEPIITVTEVARRKILELLSAEGRPGLALRMAIGGRGPGGFQYRLGFVAPEERAANDLVHDAGGFQVFVDTESAPNLQGASIDFLDGLQESGFKIDNPNVASACGCGHSFQVEDGEAPEGAHGCGSSCSH